MVSKGNLTDDILILGVFTVVEVVLDDFGISVDDELLVDEGLASFGELEIVEGLLLAAHLI